MLVYDQETFTRPFGEPNPDQDIGTNGERLIECAGRVCYDSYGRGRSSDDYHTHIAEVGHGSVWEHFNITVSVDLWMLKHLASRPGVWIYQEGASLLRVTYNPRVVLHWLGNMEVDVRATLMTAMAPFLPRIVPDMGKARWCINLAPLHEEEMWVTLYLRGSRGFSHELVRHGDRTAISQRSTRYVDESNSSWMLHPLLVERFAEYPGLRDRVESVIQDCRTCYDEIVALLEPTVGRKQARGAARGVLGNALSTELVFSASVAQWKRMIAQRLNPAADREIQDVFREQVLPGLRESQYGRYFA